MSITLKSVQLSFPNVFTPRGFEDGTPDYNTIMLLDKDGPNLDMLKQEMERVGAAKWGQKWPTIKKELEAKDRLAVHDGSMKSNLAGFDGKLYVSARNKMRPTIVDRDRTPLQEADGKIYSGVFVNGVLEIWAMDNRYGRRICASLLGLQFVKHGEAFSGGGVASVDSFESLDDEDLDDLV
jgi:hypothetical protein